jgi:hypothetical protein
MKFHLKMHLKLTRKEAKSIKMSSGKAHLTCQLNSMGSPGTSGEIVDLKKIYLLVLAFFQRIIFLTIE